MKTEAEVINMLNFEQGCLGEYVGDEFYEVLGRAKREARIEALKRVLGESGPKPVEKLRNVEPSDLIIAAKLNEVIDAVNELRRK